MQILKAYIELTKPRIVFSVLITTVLGFYLGGKGISSWEKFLFLMFGASLTCAGSSTLNHYLEREYDSKMMRTKNRPIPSGVILPNRALTFGVCLVLAGLIILYIKVNILTSFLSLLTTFLYIMVYTPMKRVSWINTTIGAIPGAIPPLGGWAAATGTLSFDAGMLFLILFIWQHPHFYAIAWMLKEDYKRGGFKMLSLLEDDGKEMFQQIIFYSIILIPVSIIPFFRGTSGLIYLAGALIAGVGLFIISQKFNLSRSVVNARKLLLATVIYLPFLLLLTILDMHF